MNWKIWGGDLPVIIIPADSFDEALAQARTVDPRYDTGQVIDQKREVIKMNWAEKELSFDQRSNRSNDIWKYIPKKVLAGVTDAYTDSDGYWIMLDHENGGWVAYDGAEDCGIIHEYTIKDLRDAIKTIRKER